jgi:hypothetical protein
MTTNESFAHGFFGCFSLRRAAGIALLAVSVSLLACANPFEGKSCTEMGCSSGASGTLDVPLPLTALDHTRLEVCHNDQCTFASIRVIDHLEGTPRLTLSCSTLTGSAGVGCGSSPVAATATSTVLDIQYGNDFAAGDRFVLRVTDPSAEKVYASREGTLQGYRTYHPNGEECDGDYMCKSGTF